MWPVSSDTEGKSMKPASVALRWTASLAAIGAGWSLLLSAAVAADPSPTVRDVALRNGGVLVGQVVDPQGVPRVGVPVTIRSGQQPLAVGITDKGGYFAFSGLQGGAYQLSTQEVQGVYRTWTPGAAPPSAQPGALIVDGTEVVRGSSKETIRFYLSNPWVWGTAAAAGIGTGTAFIIANQHPHSN